MLDDFNIVNYIYFTINIIKDNIKGNKLLPKKNKYFRLDNLVSDSKPIWIVSQNTGTN